MQLNKTLTIFLLGCFLSIYMLTESKAQTFIGDKTLTSQAEVDAFGASYTDINGNLTIQESTPGSITDINSLATLASISGDFSIIGNTSIGYVYNLYSLQSIGGDVIITNNIGLDGFGNFYTLLFIGGNVLVSNNINLQNLQFIEFIVNISGSVSIENNDALSDLDDFYSLQSIGGNLSIVDNDALPTVDGLSNLKDVGGNLYVENNDLLSKYCGFFMLLSPPNGLVGSYNISGNACNPIIADIASGGYCDNIVLKSQAAINNFGALNPIAIINNLTISGNDINDLSPLLSLINIGGSLNFQFNKILPSLTGLNNLISIGGNLFFDSNPLVNDLTGLTSLTTISGYISLFLDSGIQTLVGMPNLTSLGGFGGQFSALKNFDGLENITSISLSIGYSGGSLTNLDGLRNIKSVAGGIGFSECGNLENIDGLNGIESVGGGVSLFYCSKITNVDGLINISSIGEGPNGGSLHISNNAVLTNLDGLSNITTIKGNTYEDALYIHDNPVLDSFCGLFPLLNSSGLNGTYSVADNLINPTISDILSEGPCGAYKISYEVVLPDCENPPASPLIVTEGEFFEGQGFTFPPYTVPEQYSAYQQYYDAFVGAEFGIPVGSLNEDVHVVINLEDICAGGLIDNPNTQDIIELFFLSVEINGAVSGTHSPLEYYDFNDGKEAYLKIPLANIAPITSFLGFDTDQLTPFFTTNGLNPDFEGIRKVTDATHFNIYARHFSEVRLGVPTSITGVNDLTNEVPTEYSLNQNYPNPFNPSTSISYSIPNDGQVTLAIYDVLGNEVALLENGYKSAGTFSYNFDASNLSTGLYFYTIRSGKFTETKKMLLMK